MRECRASLESMKGKDLGELAILTEQERLADRMKALRGCAEAKESTIVVLSPTNKLTAYRLPAQKTDDPAKELTSLPNWATSAFVTQSKKFFRKRKGNNTRGGHSKRPRNNNN